MKDKNCTARLTIALTESEKRRLDALAKGEGRTTAGMTKWIIRNYLVRRSFGEPLDTARLQAVIEAAGKENEYEKTECMEME